VLRLAFGLSRFMAVLGGLVLTALILLTCASVLGRAVGLGPVTGDFEIVEAGIAFAIFAFLPLTQVSAAHAAVDVFTAYLPPGANRVLRMLWEVLLAAALIVIAVQLGQGLQSKVRSGQTTLLLQFPVWWSYAASLVAAGIAAAVGCIVAGVRIAEAVGGRVILSEGPGAEH
jgi:TRAP-type C4-dicarboxylate transport system permease small subunit